VKEVNMATATERTIMRHVTLRSLKRAYEQMMHGENHTHVCATLGIDPNVINGTLKAAVEEALWERGQLAAAAMPS
jgi:hypothetical protein